jgi:RHS repeat-associated protein
VYCFKLSYTFNPRLDSGLHADYRVKANGDKAYVNYLYAGNRPVGTYTINWAAASNTTSYDLKYFHLDGQGSIIAITNSVGAVVERLSYDAWGKRRDANGTDDLSNALVSTSTDHGYTGHEHLDDMGLIHMNGRVYDPRTGRFLQADPTIQSPGNLQSFNRYSYVMNNPFFYTDPSGFSWLGDRWKAATGTNWADSRDQYVKPIVAIAISAYVGPWASNLAGGGLWGSIVGGAASGFVSGGINGGTLNSAMQGAKGGAISGGLFYGAGSLASDGLGNVLTHAAAGCLSAAASQGDCKSSALAAAAGSAWTQTGVKFDSVVANTVMHAVVGGVTAELGGGKFENGAVTGAFGYLFNECAHGGCATEKKPSKATIEQCVSTCLQSNYGEAYEVAEQLSPLSLIGAAQEIGTKMVTDKLGTKLEVTAVGNSYSGKSGFEVSQRQNKTLSQFRFFNGATSAVGAAASGFIIGAQLYCGVSCD